MSNARGCSRLQKNAYRPYFIRIGEDFEGFSVNKKCQEVVILDYTKRFARASTATTTTSTTTKSCGSAVSELLQALLKLSEA